MKLNKKIIIPAFTLLVGTTLAGSVASTVAWYQYSTRANVSYIGTSAGTIGNLQIRLKGGEWGTRLSIQDVNDYFSAHSIEQAIEPVTPGPLAKNASLKKYVWQELDIAKNAGVPVGDLGHEYFINTSNHAVYHYENDNWVLVDLEAVAVAPDLASANVGDLYVSTANKLYQKAYIAEFYSNPIAGFGPYSKWVRASAKQYVTLPLQLRFAGKNENDLSAKDVYLSKLLIQEDMHNDDVSDHGDISDAIRVHFSAYEDGNEENAINKLVSKNGGTTLTHGKLKLEGGNDFDKAYTGDEFGFDGSSLEYINYGGNSGVQVSYGANIEAQEGVYYEEETPVSGWKQVGIVSESAAGEPDPAAGSIGDFYRDASANKIYKKVANTTWEVFADSYLSGAADPNLETGTSKDFYFKNADGAIFERGFEEEEISPILVGNDEDSAKIGNVTADKKIGSTIGTAVPPAEQHYLNVDVTIWVEGWQKFNRSNKLTSIWEQDLIGAMFDVGIQFAIQDER